MHEQQPESSAVKREKIRQDAARLAHWLDDAFRIPGTRLRVGVESLLGLAPGVGDLAGLALGLAIINMARRSGAPLKLQLAMLGNLLLEAVIGMVPVLGDLFDFIWKANQRNRRILDVWLQPEPAARPPRAAPWRWILGLLGLTLGGLLIWQLLA